MLAEDLIGALVANYEAAKLVLAPRDEHLRALYHIHGGLALWLFLVVITRSNMRALSPVLTVWVLCFLGELADLYSVWPVRYGWVWRDIAGDLFNTLLWPTLLWLHAELRHRIKSKGGIASEPREIG